MKTIMQVLPSLVQGGVETGTIEIATALKKAGIPNIVVSNGGPMVSQLEKIGVPHFQVPVQSKNPFKMAMNSFRLAKIAKEHHVGLMHVRSRAPAWSVRGASLLSGVPYIASYHGLYGTKPSVKKLYNRAMLGGAFTIAVSNCVKQHLIDEYHYPENKIHVIHRGADLEKYADAISSKRINTLAQQWHLPKNKPIICLPGRVSPVKGHLVVLEALKHMKHKNVLCLFVGSSQGQEKYMTDILDKAKELPQQTKLMCFPSCVDMPALYALSDICINARLTPEAFGRTVTEAQAMKCIVVGTKHGGACETIQDKKTGFLVPPADSQALAKVLDKILDMPLAERKKMQQAARKSVERNFSIQTMCDKTLKLYREFIR